ncbi:MFS transporter [Rhodococcus sp. 14-2483-1-2]|uniref:MFS transporter n=1 Tax=Rhodococcus sp. 14-2483-1-2 TaxID=2023147 RepID=UPI00148365D2|nr:MFS transporter [Rhodococcus sp. 14-2483-1-2]
MRKIAWRVVPLVFIGYMFSFFDRSNISFAALTMNEDLGMSSYTYGWVAGIFFVGYILLGTPSTLALGRFGARFWLSSLIVTFGVISVATAFSTSVWHLALLRFLLGAAEAGVFPGIIVYLASWFPAQYRGRMLTAFIVAVPVSAMIGGPLASAILNLNGTLGFEGWRWLFAVEGIPAILIGLVGFRYIASTPKDARWLTGEERAWLVDALAEDNKAPGALTKVSAWKLLTNSRLVVIAVAQTASVMAFYGVSLWLPQLLREITSSVTAIGWLSAVPYAVAIPGMILIGRRSDRTQDRAAHVAFAYALMAVGLLLAVIAGTTVWALIGLSLVAIGTWGGQSSIFALPGKLFGAASAAAGVGLISSISNIGGFGGPYLIGALRDSAGGFTVPFLVLAAITAVSALVVATFVRKWENSVVAPVESSDMCPETRSVKG